MMNQKDLIWMLQSHCLLWTLASEGGEDALLDIMEASQETIERLEDMQRVAPPAEEFNFDMEGDY